MKFSILDKKWQKFCIHGNKNFYKKIFMRIKKSVWKIKKMKMIKIEKKKYFKMNNYEISIKII